MQEVLSLVRKPFEYEDADKQEIALSTLPLAQLFDEAEIADGSEYAEEDRIIISLLRWFKQWFKWVNEAPCETCGEEKTTLIGVAEPSHEDRRFGANTVEQYQCPKCATVTRFPRYNDPIKLLETRRGRCGEWCNVMTLLLRSLGRDVRYIWNSEDHVWNEVWSETQDRWIHLDSCEAAFDKPLTYSDGWGKKMAYVIGFSTSGARDVTARYVRREDAALPRSRFPEPALHETLSMATASIRNRMDPVDQVVWFERDEAETRELQSVDYTKRGEGHLPRQSGSAGWTRSRGEAGS